MNNSSSAPVWAILTILFGFVIAIPFFKRPKNPEAQAAGSPKTERLAQQFRSERIVSGKLPEVTRPRYQPTVEQSERDLVELVRAQLRDQPNAVALPDWAEPESRLDALIQTGAKDIAAFQPEKTLGELPTLYTSPEDRQHRELAEAATAPKELAQLAGSPWENGQAPHYVNKPTPGTLPTWGDEALVARARVAKQQRTPPVVADFMSVPPEVEVMTIGAKRHSQVGSRQVISDQQPAEHKRRRFVYQPGIQIPE